MNAWKRDVLIVAITAGLSSLIATQDPLTWRALLGVCLSITVAIKAKLSPDKHDTQTISTEQDKK